MANDDNFMAVVLDLYYAPVPRGERGSNERQRTGVSEMRP